MIVENKVQLLINLDEWVKAVGLTETLIYDLIYVEKEECSISTQHSLNLFRNLDYVDVAYIND